MRPSSTCRRRAFCLVVSANNQGEESLRLALQKNPDNHEAMFQCAWQMEFISKFDIARHYYQLFVDTFPSSGFTPKATARLAEFQG